MGVYFISTGSVILCYCDSLSDKLLLFTAAVYTMVAIYRRGSMGAVYHTPRHTASLLALPQVLALSYDSCECLASENWKILPVKVLPVWLSQNQAVNKSGSSQIAMFYEYHWSF